MAGSLTIGRIQADCRVVGASVAAQRFRDRTTRALQRDLNAALRSRCGSWFDGEDDSMWMVRRLELSLLVPDDGNAESLASSAADAMGRALAAGLVGHGDGENFIKFDDPAAFLTRYVLDVARGMASSRWYYAPFAGLAQLPASAAIRAALTRSPAQGVGALTGMSDRELDEVCAALDRTDEAQILQELLSPPGDASAEGMSSPGRRAAVATRSLLRDAGGNVLVPVRLAETIRCRRTPQVTQEWLPGGSAKTSPMEPLTRGNAIAATGSLDPAVSGSIGSIGWLDSPAGWTRFGGLLLLLESLSEVPWADWAKAWPAPTGSTAGHALRWMTVSLCAGKQLAAAVMRDPVLRDLLGIGAQLDSRGVASWLNRVGPRRQKALRMRIAGITALEGLGSVGGEWFGMPAGSGIGPSWRTTLVPLARYVLRRFAARLPGFAESTPAFLWRNVLAFDATVGAEPDRIVVRCGRPPLHLLLALTGMIRGSRVGTDPVGRPIIAFPEE